MGSICNLTLTRAIFWYSERIFCYFQNSVYVQMFVFCLSILIFFISKSFKDKLKVSKVIDCTKIGYHYTKDSKCWLNNIWWCNCTSHCKRLRMQPDDHFAANFHYPMADNFASWHYHQEWNGLHPWAIFIHQNQQSLNSLRKCLWIKPFLIWMIEFQIKISSFQSIGRPFEGGQIKIFLLCNKRV